MQTDFSHSQLCRALIQRVRHSAIREDGNGAARCSPGAALSALRFIP